jgi:hypothetical protein
VCRQARFFRYWTRNEAQAKLTGAGLRFGGVQPHGRCRSFRIGALAASVALDARRFTVRTIVVGELPVDGDVASPSQHDYCSRIDSSTGMPTWRAPGAM